MGAFFVLNSKLYFYTMKSLGRFLFIAIFLFSCFSQAQQAYREDQIYIDVNFILQHLDNDRFSDNGFSRSLHLGVLRDIFLTPSGEYALGLGVGYGLTRLVNNLEVSPSAGVFEVSYPRPDRSYRNFFTYHELQFPVELRWRKSTVEEHKFWRIHAGYRFSRPFGLRYKPFFGPDFPVDGVLSRWHHEASLSVGYNTWNLRFAYQLNPLLRSEVRSASGDRFPVRTIQLGLIFYLL